eukprot:2199360-Pleurochrysis_carterae.AAC.1
MLVTRVETDHAPAALSLFGTRPRASCNQSKHYSTSHRHSPRRQPSPIAIQAVQCKRRMKRAQTPSLEAVWCGSRLRATFAQKLHTRTTSCSLLSFIGDIHSL